MRNSLPAWTALALSFLLLTACDKSYKDDSKVLVKVNGAAVTEQAYQHYRETLQTQQRTEIPDNEQNQSLLLEQMVFNRLMAQEAINQELNLKPEIHFGIELQRDELLIGAVARNYLQSNPIKDEDIKNRYAELKKTYEYQIRHILVSEQKLATEIISKLKSKKSITTLAKKYSTHGQTKNHGGLLGWVGREFIVPAVYVAADKQKKPGLIGEPVKSAYGWHVVRVDKVRKAKVPPLKTIQQAIASQLQREKISELGRYLHTGGKVEYIGKSNS